MQRRQRPSASLARTLAATVVAAVVLTACGSENAADPPTDPTAAPATTAPATTAPITAPVTTSAAPTTAVSTTSTAASTTVADGTVVIDVRVGVDDATTVGERVERVPLGSLVRLTLVSDDDEEYHVHEPYDLEQRVAAGVPATFEFTADQPGEVIVESHITGDPLVTLLIS